MRTQGLDLIEADTRSVKLCLVPLVSRMIHHAALDAARRSSKVEDRMDCIAGSLKLDSKALDRLIPRAPLSQLHRALARGTQLGSVE